jgi:hypothetical protein
MASRENLPPKRYLLAAALVSAFAALLTLAFILINGVNVPFADEWWYGPLVKSVGSGHATFDTFWSPNNEHRMLIPRIEFSVLAVLTRWNSKAMMIAGWLAAVAAAFVIFEQFKTIYPRRHPKLWVAAVGVSAASLFSLVQIENWLWAFQFTFFFIQFATVAALVVVCRAGLPLWIRLAISGVLAVAASFSSAQGLLVWPALMLSFALTDDSLRKKVPGLLFLFGAAVTTFAIYFSGMHRTTELHLAKEQIIEKVQLPLFGFLGLVGNPLAHWISYEHLPHRAWFIGLSVSVLFLVLTWITAKYRRLPAAAPWIGLGFYACLFCVATTYGRLGMGYTGGFLASRYTTHVALLPIALLALLLIALESTDAQQTQNRSWIMRVRIPAAVVAILAIATLIVTGDLLIFRTGQIEKHDRLLAKALIPFAQYFDPEVDGAMTGPLYPLCPLPCLTIFNPGIKDLRDAGYLREFDDIRFVTDGPSVSGNYAVSRKIAEQRYLGIVTQGWKLSGTVTADPNFAPELIFFRPAGREAFIAATGLRSIRDRGNSGHSYEWHLFLSPFILPDRNDPLEMWVYNAQANAFVKVSQTLERWETNDDTKTAGG